MAVTVDVTNDQSTHAMATQALQRFGRIDILVNNAAIYGGLKVTPFDQIPETEWDQVMAVNVKGIWLCCRAVIPVMKQQGKGKIINISSGTIWHGTPFLLHYVTSKGAVFALTRALARELTGTGINVNTITPGYTMTEASKTLVDPETFAGFKQRVLVGLPSLSNKQSPPSSSMVRQGAGSPLVVALGAGHVGVSRFSV